MKELMVYIHGKGGNIQEIDQYSYLNHKYDLIGFDYQSNTPWEAIDEFPKYFKEISKGYNRVSILANSIGAYFALVSLGDFPIHAAYLISPIVDMEKLIRDMMLWANCDEITLKQKKEIQTDFGETLSYEYLSYVMNHPVNWNIPTYIMYGQNDHLTSIDTIKKFSKKYHATYTIFQGGEHYFHTKEQMDFIQTWLLENTEEK